MKIDKGKSVSFTGHRTEKIVAGSNNSEILCCICERLRMIIKELYEDGYENFICGVAPGFDMMASEVILEMKKEHTQIKLILIVPSQDEEFIYSYIEKQNYNKIYKMADEVIVAPKSEDADILYYHTDFLLSNSSKIICYYNDNEKNSGTIHIVSRAKEARIPIINLNL